MQRNSNNKKKKSIRPFIAVFAVIVAVMVISTILREKVVLLDVPDNTGASQVETIDEDLVAVFQDGQVVSWKWNTLPQQTGDFKALSAQAIILDAGRLAAVNTTGKKVLTVYTLPDGQKQKDLSVGWEDQDVWLRISPDKKTIALIRCNAPDSKDSILYEFLTLNVETERTGSPVPMSIQQDTEDFVDYALANDKVIYAVGSKEDRGRIAAVDLDKGTIQWDKVLTDAKELCSVMVSPDSSVLYAGSRDGMLYKLKVDTGELLRKIKLLEDGETRPITNDYSVLNLACSPDRTYYVATINPKVYIFEADSEEIIHNWKPADRLVSKIAFSPNSQFVATSDVRAGWPVKIWPMPEDK